MSSFNVGAVFQIAGTVVLDLETDAAELAAGAPVTTPSVKVGTMNGKPIGASVTLQEMKE